MEATMAKFVVSIKAEDFTPDVEAACDRFDSALQDAADKLFQQVFTRQGIKANWDYTTE